MEKIITGLLFLYLVLFPFGQLNRFPFRLPQAPEIRFYLTDIVLFFLLLSWGLWRFFKIKRKYQPPPLTKPIFLFSFFAVISLVVNIPLLTGREVMVAALYLIRLLVYFGFYFVIYDLKWPNLPKFLLILGVAVAVFGLVQYFLWPDMSALAVLGWDPHYYRLVGTFLDPGFTGIILVLTLILLMVSNWEKFKNLCSKNFILYSIFFILYSTLALTYSRSSYLAYLIGMGVIAFIKKAPRFFLIILFIGALTLLILPRQSGGEGIRLERTSTVQARVGNWQQALIIAREHPIFGVGFNAYRYAQRKYGFLNEGWQVSHAGAGADSSFSFVLATTGIAGLTTYLWLWFKIIKLAWEKRNSVPGLVVLTSAGALLTHSWFNNSLFYPWIMAWMGILLTKENK